MMTERLFVAISLPPAVRTALTAVMTPVPGVTWSQPEQVHLTLRFLGAAVPTTLMNDLVKRFADVRVMAFILPVEGVGAFPSVGAPRVIWTGVGHAHPRLFQLRQRIDDAALGAGLKFDVRTFLPHATLGRCSEHSGPAVTRWLQKQREFVAPPFRVESFELYASELRPSGAVHTLRDRFELTA